jgi:uncharacterized protein YdaU (DUF1376 family)
VNQQGENNMTKKNVKSNVPDNLMTISVPDYIADTMHLSTEQHGAYLRLLMFIHAQGGLPTDEPGRARVAGLSASKWRAMRTTIMELIDAEYPVEASQ